MPSPFDPVQLNTGPLGPPLMAAPAQPKKKGGMFGSGLGVGEAIVAALNGYLAGRGNPVGLANMQMMQQRHQQALEEAKYQNHRKDDFSDWVAQQAYKAANPDPANPTSFQNDYEWFQQHNPAQAEQFANAHAASGGSPFGPMFTDPATGQRYMMGGGQQQSLPPVGSVMDDPRKQGGPMPQASGGFPSSGH